jgi:hypothetical protein
MSWYSVSDSRLRYRGRIDRGPLHAWLGTPEGIAAMAEIAQGIGFRLFGRTRAARREVWRSLEHAARSEPFRTALEGAADQYARAVSELAYASALPRVQVALRRIVLIPRAMIAGKARTAIARWLRSSPGLPAVDDAVQKFFFEQVVVELDAAVHRARPAPRRPVHATQDWGFIGVDTKFFWIDPYWSGPGWLGHMIVYEIPPGGMSRRDEKAVDAAVRQLESAIGNLSRQRRQDLVRTAGLSATGT